MAIPKEMHFSNFCDFLVKTEAVKSFLRECQISILSTSTSRDVCLWVDLFGVTLRDASGQDELLPFPIRVKAFLIKLLRFLEDAGAMNKNIPRPLYSDAQHMQRVFDGAFFFNCAATGIQRVTFMISFTIDPA